MSDLNTNTTSQTRLGEPTIKVERKEKQSAGILFKRYWPMALVGFFIILIGLLVVAKNSVEAEESAVEDEGNDFLTTASTQFHRAELPSLDAIDNLELNESNALKNGDKSQDAQSDLKLPSLEDAIAKDDTDDSKDSSNSLPPLPQELEKVEPAPLPEPSFARENPYIPQYTGEKELTLEERILQSDLMLDGGENEPYESQKYGSKTKDEDSTEYYKGELSDELRAVHTPKVKATRIDPELLPYMLSKGTYIPCTLSTKMDTTVPGMTTCVVSRDVYSANGKSVLIERGSTITGEYRGAVQNGLERIFVLWTEVRTPYGVSVDLNSPAADALGGAGMGGQVDHHWWRRFGSALLFSIVADGFEFATNQATVKNSNGNEVTINNSSDAMHDIISEAMSQAGNIPPVLIKNQGEKVGVMVARDVDFSSVYKLQLDYPQYHNFEPIYYDELMEVANRAGGAGGSGVYVPPGYYERRPQAQSKQRQ